MSPRPLRCERGSHTPVASQCPAILRGPSCSVSFAAPPRSVSCEPARCSTPFTLIESSTDIFEHAALLEPAILRSLDALRLAAALALGDELEGIVTYDDRQAEAARSDGVAVVGPA